MQDWKLLLRNWNLTFQFTQKTYECQIITPRPASRPNLPPFASIYYLNWIILSIAYYVGSILAPRSVLYSIERHRTQKAGRCARHYMCQLKPPLAALGNSGAGFCLCENKLGCLNLFGVLVGIGVLHQPVLGLGLFAENSLHIDVL